MQLSHHVYFCNLCLFHFSNGGDNSCWACLHYNIATTPLKRWVCLPSLGSGLAFWFSLTNSIWGLVEMILGSRGLQGFFVSLLLDGGTETSMLWNLEWTCHLETEAGFCQAPSHPAAGCSHTVTLWDQQSNPIKPQNQREITSHCLKSLSFRLICYTVVDDWDTPVHTNKTNQGTWQEAGLLCFWNYCPGNRWAV